MESIKIISLIKHYIEFAIQKDKSQKLNKLQEDLKKIDNKAQNLLNQYVNDKINDFLDLTPAKQYRFIHEHLKRINIDINTRIVIFEYNSH